MGRKPTKLVKEGQSIQVSFRIDKEVVDALDRIAASVMERNPGLNVTRSDAARMALTEFLDRERLKRTR